MPDEWRREIFVSAGPNASLRFYDELASLARERLSPSRARDLAETAVRSVDWAAFAGDPTGDAPLPVMRLPAPAAAIALSRSRRPGNRRGPGRKPHGPGRRIELLIAGGETGEAMAEAERWLCSRPHGPAEPWFGLSARLASAAGERLPAWLDALEAEREIAGGRLEEAEKRLAGAADSPEVPEEREAGGEAASGRSVSALRGRMKEAGRLAAAWRRDFSDAPAEDSGPRPGPRIENAGPRGEHEAALALSIEPTAPGRPLDGAGASRTAPGSGRRLFAHRKLSRGTGDV